MLEWITKTKKSITKENLSQNLELGNNGNNMEIKNTVLNETCKAINEGKKYFIWK